MTMGMQYKEQGGGPATGLANDFTKWLDQGLKTGSFGAGTSMGQFGAATPTQDTYGISGVLNDILSGGAGKLGGAMAKNIETRQTNDIAALRARFGAGGGTSFGTPAAYAESDYRAKAAPEVTSAVGNLQLGALGPLLQMINSMSQKGITQRTGAYQSSGWMQAAQLFAKMAGAVANGKGMFAGVGDAGDTIQGLPTAGQFPNFPTDGSYMPFLG